MTAFPLGRFTDLSASKAADQINSLFIPNGWQVKLTSTNGSWKIFPGGLFSQPKGIQDFLGFASLEVRKRDAGPWDLRESSR